MGMARNWRNGSSENEKGAEQVRRFFHRLLNLPIPCKCANVHAVSWQWSVAVQTLKSTRLCIVLRNVAFRWMICVVEFHFQVCYFCKFLFFFKCHYSWK